VEITGSSPSYTLECLEGRVAHTDLERIGTFECSNDLINRIHQNIQWGLRSNFMGIPTDCPQRDERYGWLGDAHLAAESAMLNFDAAAFYAKFLTDIRLALREDGALPDFVPPYLGKPYPADPAWGSAYITIAWHLYLLYGDRNILEEHFESMKAYVAFLDGQADGHLQKTLGKYGDWCPPGSIRPEKTPLELTSTWYYYHDTLLLAKIASAIHKQEAARRLERKAKKIQEAFNRAFLHENHYGLHFNPPNQTTQVLPLYLGLVPDNKVKPVLNALVQSVVDHHDYHLDTGILGTRYLLDVLTTYGYGDVAFKIATQKTYPSWGYMVEEGATTLWERWEKITGEGMNSHNHIMLGSVDAWFYRTLAGIACDSPGWSRVKIKPHPFEGLSHASASIKTIRGDCAVKWKRETDSFTLIIRIPVGARALVHLPLLWKSAEVFESGRLIWKKEGAGTGLSDGITLSGLENNYLVFETGSGTYHFEAKAR
jgi:alpha-L-rhamnosidase